MQAGALLRTCDRCSVTVAVFQIDVVELQLQLTEPMRGCQTALLDLIDACVKELKRGNRLVRCCCFLPDDRSLFSL